VEELVALAEVQVLVALTLLEAQIGLDPPR